MLSVVFNKVRERLEFGFGWVILFPDCDKLSPYVRASSWVGGSAHAIFVCWLGYWRQASFPFYYFMCSRRSPTSIFRPRELKQCLKFEEKKTALRALIRHIKIKLLAPYYYMYKSVSCWFTLFSFRYCWADTFVFLDKKIISSGKCILYRNFNWLVV